MLILGRKTGDEILLGNDVVIKIIEISKGNVKIGIQAPQETLILRGELKREIEQANQDAIVEISPDTLENLSRMLKK